MKIVIPMAGLGERFIEVGYSVPKPLIPVDGKPMIEHVVNLFSPRDDFVFVCNDEHSKITAMRQTLTRIAPDSSIISIPYVRKGPVWSILEALKKEEFLSDHEPVIVNYCDFGLVWSYSDFLQTMKTSDCDGCIPSYKGFHPHQLGHDYYGYLKLDQHNRLVEIREKKPYTSNKMNEYTAAGMYYFKKGSLLKKYGAELLDRGLAHTNGEYYVSLIYNLMVRDGLTTTVYGLPYFLQWGTPRDLQEYSLWSSYFAEKVGKNKTEQKSTELLSSIQRSLTPEQFEQCHTYWQACFSKLAHHPYSTIIK